MKGKLKIRKVIRKRLQELVDGVVQVEESKQAHKIPLISFSVKSLPFLSEFCNKMDKGS